MIARGLADNWSQVRFMASTAVRQFFKIGNIDVEVRDKYYPIFIPMMCLNRYYLAEGVRLYSQETWKQVVGEKGKEIVLKYLDEVVVFYISQSRADNHAVREAACHCISELCSKVVSHETEAAKKYIKGLLETLIDCFKDMSWPVRDAACVACGQFVLAFPEEAEEKYPELFKMWISHLSDNINSVRENSACALGNSIRAYKKKGLDNVLEKLNELLPMVKKQEPDSKKFTDFENESVFGVAKEKGVKNIVVGCDAEHTNQMMYSCGSLAPKLRREAAKWTTDSPRKHNLGSLPMEQSTYSGSSQPFIQQNVLNSSLFQQKLLDWIISATQAIYEKLFSIASPLFSETLEKQNARNLWNYSMMYSSVLLKALPEMPQFLQKIASSMLQSSSAQLSFEDEQKVTAWNMRLNSMLFKRRRNHLQEQHSIQQTHLKNNLYSCLLYTSPSPRDLSTSRMPSSA
eukprot:TRINITY_DN4733_c0_g2_i2.p1 TRINITY_DN4733_c0_g2~~TRINITY_DN4733_c0_g2_i2.p1  ORF type:complete len:514 (-),score=96.93 TRINITY_DN4733_c0_g2_i2:41-1417(-)